MTTTRTHFTFRVDTWAPDSEVRAARMDEGWGRHSINRVRYRHHDESIFLYAFDLIELNGDDLRPVTRLSLRCRLSKKFCEQGC